MTISSTTSSITYSGDGTSTAFAVPYIFFGTDEITVTARVTATGVETVQTLGTHYTVSGGNGAAGTVTATTAPPTGTTWTIQRATDRLQATDFQDYDPFPANTVETAIDRLTCIAQEIERDALRAVRVPVTDPATVTLPSSVERASKALWFDAEGEPIAVAGTSGSVPITAYGATLVDDVDAAAARTTLGLGSAAVLSAANLLSYTNRLMNPAMMHSIEHGTANVDATSGVYTLDQWIAALSSTPGGTLRVAQVVSRTPGGSPNRLRATVQVADTSIAAGDRYAIEQPIEGHRIADAEFGGAAAKQILVRFGFRSPLAGTFGVALSNAAGTRSWVGTFTVGAGEVGTDIVRTFVIPGDTTGAWPADPGTRGLLLRITLAAGTTWQGAAGWSAGNFFTTSAQVNGMATGGHVFELFDTGLWVDTLGLGVVPPFVLPDPVVELAKIQRHTYRLERNIFARGVQVVGFGTSINNDVNFPTRMMGTPTTSGVVLSNSIGAASSAVENLSPDGFTVRVTANAAANGEVSIRLDSGALFLSRL